MKVQVRMEIEVPDGTESCYENEDQCTALGAEITENIVPIVKQWLCNEVVPVEDFEQIKIAFKHFYPTVFTFKKYYVIKDGRMLSDYDNIDDARNHAKQIDGEVGIDCNE